MFFFFYGTTFVIIIRTIKFFLKFKYNDQKVNLAIAAL